MNDPMDDFIGQAKRVGMSEDEREIMKKQLFNEIATSPVRKSVDVRQKSNMDTSFNTFVASAKGVCLSDAERSAIRGNILSQAARRDIAASDAVRPGLLSWFWLLKGVPVMAAFVLVIGIGAGMAYAAEDALPGDLLYPVKINVNERLAAALALSAREQAYLEAQNAERRLKEAEILAAQKRLDAGKKAVIQVAFEEHAKNVHDSIVQLASSEDSSAALEIGNEFEAALDAHAAVMQRLRENNDEQRVIADLVGEVQTTKDTIGRSRATLEIALTTAPDSQRQHTAEQVLDGAKARLESLRADIRQKRVVELLHKKLQLADDNLNLAGSKIQAGAYVDSFNLVRSSIRETQETQLLADLGIAVDSGGGIAMATDSHGSLVAETSASSSTEIQGSSSSAAAVQQNLPGDIVQTGRDRVKAARELLAKRRAALSQAAVNEATLKLEGADKTLGLAADFSTKGQTEERDSYANAALSAVGYVETFIKEPVATDAAVTAKTGTAASSPSSSSSQSSVESSAVLIFSPRYKPAKKALEDFEALRDRSRGLVDQQSVDAASALLVKAQATLVLAQASFDAGAEADANTQFDKVLAQAKEATGILAKAAQAAITQSSAAASSVRSSSSAGTAASAGASAQTSVSSSTQATASTSSSKTNGALDPVLSTPLPVPGL